MHRAAFFKPEKSALPLFIKLFKKNIIKHNTSEFLSPLIAGTSALFITSIVTFYPLLMPFLGIGSLSFFFLKETLKYKIYEKKNLYM